MRINQSLRTILYFDGEDSVNNYIGEAPTGSATSSPVWRIYRLQSTGTASLNKKWADGSDLFNKVWDDRATYTY